MRESRKSNATEVITGRSVNVLFLYRLQSGRDPKVFRAPAVPVLCPTLPLCIPAQHLFWIRHLDR